MKAGYREYISIKNFEPIPAIACHLLRMEKR
jgi:hypothetical protein